VVKVALRPPVTAYRHTPRGMIMLSAAAHTTQAYRRPMVEQAAAVEVRTAGTEPYSLTEYVTQPGWGAPLPLHKGKHCVATSESGYK